MVGWTRIRLVDMVGWSFDCSLCLAPASKELLAEEDRVDVGSLDRMKGRIEEGGSNDPFGVVLDTIDGYGGRCWSVLVHPMEHPCLERLPVPLQSPL